MIDKNTIYSYFQTDDFPTEEQFRATWDSFWHKSESIPMSQITGLNQLFQQTATVAQLNNKANVDGSNITNSQSWRDTLSLYSKSETDNKVENLSLQIATERNSNNNQDSIIQILESSIDELQSWKSQLTDADTDNIVNTLSELLATFQYLPEGTDIYALINSKINTSDIVNNLTSLSTTKVLSANQGKVLKDLIDSLSIGGLIEVTYDELVNLKNTSTLVKGQNYLLTDYMTTYIQPVTGINKSSDVIEPLIITATDVNKLHNVCKSTLYPQDIVYYEITGDIGNGYGTEGFTKGKIYRRIDTLRNNDIGTDWRHVKYDRNGVDKLLFKDYNDCYNNVIKTYNLFNSVVGNGFAGNTIGNRFSSNTIGESFRYNTIGNYFTDNTIGESFQSNTIGKSFQNNTIGDSFNNNTIDTNFNFNTIGDSFQSNTIGDNFNGNGNQTTPFLSKNTEFRNYISNFTSSIEIQNVNIDVVVFKSPTGIRKQRYYDDSNNLVINNL